MRQPRVVSPKAAEARHRSSRGADTVLRFRASERVLHWAIAVPFLVCFVTAAILVLWYNPAPWRPHREVISWIHRGSGIALFVLPTLAFAVYRRDFGAHLANIREAWVWTLSDLRWLALMGLAAFSKRFELPEQGKFNAAEKLNFMTVMTTYPLYIVTGALIWLPGVAFGAWVLHVSIAALATPLVLGHIFMATINPSTRVGLQGMISGFVDRRWAKHHYGRWYREQHEGAARSATSDPTSVPVATPGRTLDPVRWIPVKVRCPSCDEVHAVRSFAAFAKSVFQDTPLSCPGCGQAMEALAVLASPSDLEAILQRLDRADSLGNVDDGASDRLRAPGARSTAGRERRPHAYDMRRWADQKAIPVSDMGPT